MNILFFTKPKASTLECLKFLYEQGEELLGVVVYDSKRFKGGEFWNFCIEKKIKIYDGDEIYSDSNKFRDKLDVIFVNTYPKLIKDSLIQMAKKGADNGPVIDTREFEYFPTDSILTSYVKVNLCKADMILKNIENGRIKRKEGKPQEENGFYLPQRKKEDGKIDWNRDAADIYNMVRALTKPYPGAFTNHGETEFIIWSARPVMVEDVFYLYEKEENGTVLSILGDSALIKCGKDLLLIESCTNYDKLKEGMVFESADYKKQMKEIVERHKKKYDTKLSQLVLDEIK